jgi:hypothetical protein
MHNYEISQQLKRYKGVIKKLCFKFELHDIYRNEVKILTLLDGVKEIPIHRGRNDV